MLKRRIIWLVVAVTCSSAMLPVACSAQALTSSDVAAIAQPNPDTITDVFVGKSTRGPYMLSWNNIQADSEIILASGRKLIRGQDYSIDPASGAIALTETLAQDTVARVTYRRVPGKSMATGGGLDLPVNIGLLDSGRANLNVLGFYKGAGSGSPGVSTGVIGLSGGLKLNEKSDFSSMFFINQGDTRADGRRVGFSDRMGMKLGTTTSLGNMTFKGSFARAGRQFAGAQQYGLQAAKKLLDLAAMYGKSSDAVSASFSYTQQGDTGAQTGANQTTSQQKIVLNLQNAPRVTLSHTTNDQEASGTATGVAATAVQLEQNFGAKTSAVASLEKAELTTGQSKDEVQTTRLALQSSAIDKVQLSGGVTLRDSEQLGAETGLNVSVKAAPLENMKLEASYAGKQFTQGTDEAQSAVRLEAQPAKYVKVSAAMGQSDVGQLQNTNKEAALDISPSDKLHVATSINQTTDGQSTTTITNYSGAVKPASYLQLSGGFKNRQCTNAEALDTTSVGLALEPIKAFKITGQYARNPEDQAGLVQQLRSTAVGVQMRVGILGITGAFSENDQYAMGLTSMEKQVGLNLPVFGHGRLTTGVKMEQAIQMAQQSATTYSVGYTHIIGSSFNLSLEGELVKYDNQTLSAQQEYKATAKLGMSF